jgi:hypothetical protein
MTAIYHTPITTGAAANAETFNAPLGELDAALAALQDRVNNSGNYAINGGFDLAQAQSPAELTEIANRDYGPDQWWVSFDAGGVQYSRVQAIPTLGLSSKYWGMFTKSTSAGKMFICQPIEGGDMIPLRGKSVVFQIKMIALTEKTVRMAVLELQDSGTMDEPPSTLVAAFGADGALPTFGPNVAIIGTSVIKTVTSSFQNFDISVTIPTDSKNLFLAVWTDAAMDATDILGLAEADFFLGVLPRSWAPRPILQEISLCQRYYWKTYDLDTAPVYDSGEDLYTNSRGAGFCTAGKAGATVASVMLIVRLPVVMFSTPNVITNNPAAADSQMFDFIHGGNCSSTHVETDYTSPSTIVVAATGNAATTVGDLVGVHLAASARIL